METDVRIKHLTKRHYAGLVVLTLLSLAVIIGFTVVVDVKPETNESKRKPIGDSPLEFRLFHLTSAELRLSITLRMYMNLQSFDSFKQTVLVNFVDIDDHINDTQKYTFECYPSAGYCGSTLLVQQEVYRRGFGRFTIQAYCNATDPALCSPDVRSVSLYFVKTNQNLTIAFAVFELLVMTISIAIFILYIFVELHYVFNRGKFTSMQLMNGILVLSLVFYCSPWTVFAYLTQSLIFFLLERFSLTVFTCSFYCFLFFGLVFFFRQEKKKIPRSWYLCVLFISCLFIQLVGSLLDFFAHSQHTLTFPDSTLSLTSAYFICASDLLQLFLYGWSLYLLFTVYSTVTTPVLQTQLSFFSIISAAFLSFLMILLFFFHCFSKESSFFQFFRDALIINYVVWVLAAFLPTTRQVKNKYSLFYNEAQGDNPLVELAQQQ